MQSPMDVSARSRDEIEVTPYLLGRLRGTFQRSRSGRLGRLDRLPLDDHAILFDLRGLGADGIRERGFFSAPGNRMDHANSFARRRSGSSEMGRSVVDRGNPHHNRLWI